MNDTDSLGGVVPIAAKTSCVVRSLMTCSLAMHMRARDTSAGEKSGKAARTCATAPATWGVAMEGGQVRERIHTQHHVHHHITHTHTHHHHHHHHTHHIHHHHVTHTCAPPSVTHTYPPLPRNTFTRHHVHHHTHHIHHHRVTHSHDIMCTTP